MAPLSMARWAVHDAVTAILGLPVEWVSVKEDFVRLEFGIFSSRP